MPAIIEVRDLEKRFKLSKRRPGPLGAVRGLFSTGGREVAAVEHLDFEVHAGEMVGYIGPNGAGKSTTIKMLTGILVPTSGDVHVDGLVPWRHRARLASRIGVVFGQRTQLWWDLPLIESLQLLRHVYRVPKDRFERCLVTLVETLDIGDFLEKPVRQLSLGQRMRGDLAASLLHEPSILYLDEPTIGLDVVAKERIRTFLLDLNRRQGVTVLLTTHDMADVTRLCDRVLIIDHGRLLYDGTVEEILDLYGQERRMVVDLDEDVEHPETPGARIERREGARLWLTFRRDEVTASELLARLSSRYKIRDLTIQEPDIEGVVRKIYQEGMS